MGRVTGLGGVFLNISGDTRKLLNWYHEVLGLEITEYGINFLVPNKFTLLTFQDNESGSTVLNFTVDDLESLMKVLEAKDVKVIQAMQVYEYGKFARIEDILGNVVELWEPFEDSYRRMVEQEIEDFHRTRTEK